MADVVTVTKLVEGPRNAVFHLTNVSDGTGESAVAKVALADLDPVLASDFVIEKITFATAGMSVNLLWDATTDVLAVCLPQDQAGELCWEDVGGLKNTAGSGKTGTLLLTTVGHASGDAYAITLYLKKKG